MAEMRRVCKHGGLFAARECVWDGMVLHPDPTGLHAKVWNLTAQSMRYPSLRNKSSRGSLTDGRASGSDPNIGLQLKSLAVAAGCTPDDVSCTGAVLAYFAPDGARFWAESSAGRCRAGGVREWALQSGTTEQELEQMESAILDWGRAMDACWVLPQVELLARK
jgi:hypothetical protein